MMQDPEVLVKRVVFKPDRSLWRLPGPDRSKAFEAQDIAARYARAHGYFLDKAKTLKEELGWKAIDAAEGTLVHVEHGPANSLQQVHLPRTFDDFLDTTKPTYAPKVFSENPAFKVEHMLSHPTDLRIDAPKPIADMFYMMQCIAPGMLQIVFIEDFNDFRTQTMTRLLPTKSWVEKNKSALTQMSGEAGEAAFDALLLAARFDVKVENDLPADDYDEPFAEDLHNLDDEDDFDDFNLVEDDLDDDFYMDKFGMMGVADGSACDQICGYCGGCVE